MYYRIRITGIVTLVSVLCGCGLFSPQDVEDPAQDNRSNADPLNFSDILSNNKEEFRFFDYEDLFNAGFSYRTAGESYDREPFIERIEDIVSEHIRSQDSLVSVAWSREDTASNDNFGISDTVQLNSRIYEISFQGSSDTLRGEAELVLV